jgi:hypothetical protein
MLKKTLIVSGMILGSLVLSGCGSLSPQLQAKVDKLDYVGSKGKTIKLNKTYKITYPTNEYVGNDFEDRNKLQEIIINKALRTAVKKSIKNHRVWRIRNGWVKNPLLIGGTRFLVTGSETLDGTQKNIYKAVIFYQKGQGRYSDTDFGLTANIDLTLRPNDNQITLNKIQEYLHLYMFSEDEKDIADLVRISNEFPTNLDNSFKKVSHLSSYYFSKPVEIKINTNLKDKQMFIDTAKEIFNFNKVEDKLHLLDIPLDKQKDMYMNLDREFQKAHNKLSLLKFNDDLFLVVYDIKAYSTPKGVKGAIKGILIGKMPNKIMKNLPNILANSIQSGELKNIKVIKFPPVPKNFIFNTGHKMNFDVSDDKTMFYVF